MTYRTDINDDLLVSMYADPTNRITDLETHFDACGRTLRRHLRANGVVPDRKTCNPWNIDEEGKLFDAKRLGLTGAELKAAVPTRTLHSIKGHVVSMQCRGIDMQIDMEMMK